ncbi:hypothetical protein ACJX0J_037009, partial [Zea mays]
RVWTSITTKTRHTTLNGVKLEMVLEIDIMEGDYCNAPRSEILILLRLASPFIFSPIYFKLLALIYDIQPLCIIQFIYLMTKEREKGANLVFLYIYTATNLPGQSFKDDIGTNI